MVGVKTDGYSDLINFFNKIGPFPTLFNYSRHFSLLTGGSPEALRGVIPPKYPQSVEVLTLFSVKTDGHSGLTNFVYNIGPLPALFNNSGNFSLLTGGLREH